MSLTEELSEEFGITAARERDRRGSVARAATRIAQQDPRYTRILVERSAAGYVLRAERPIAADVLPLPLPAPPSAGW